MITKLTLAALATSFLAACAVGPDHQAPQPGLPSSWSALETKAEGQESVASTKDADLSSWWMSFRDPVLASLIDRALSANLDLKVAAARVREARAIHGIAQGGLLPEVGAGAGYDRRRLSENGPFPSDGKAFNLHQAGFDASWEIDVFGGNRRQAEAADAEVGAAVENLRDVRVSLAAEVARGYVDLRGAQLRLTIAQRNLAAQRQSAEHVRNRVEAGRAPELDQVRAEAQVSATSSTIPALEASVRRALHQLAVLLGQPPVAPATELAEIGSIPSAPSEIPVGLPTDLLRRRPDIRRAERELAAATARIGVATADLYPKFFLVGSLGLESLSASDLFSAGSRAGSFGPRVQWSLFQGGRIRANIEVQNARQEQAALRFERTLLGALEDVENALVSHAKEQTRRADLLRAVASQRRAVELAEQRYREGLTDFLSVLDAQRGLLEAQDLQAQSEQAVAANAIALYKAVGGGWSAE